MKQLLKIVCVFMLTLFAQVSLAKSVNLYDQPKADAKVIGSIDSEAGIIPIFSNNDWVKVGDPRNGNVGWIKSSELSNVNSTGITFKVITTGTGPQSYRIVQFGAPTQITAEQAQAMYKQIQLQQQTLQTDIQKMMQDMFNQQKIIFPQMPGIMMPPQTQTQPQVQPTTTTPATTKPAPASATQKPQQ